jgi:hypothetical protein
VGSFKTCHLSASQRRVTMENITCSVCNEPFSSRYSVRRHITRKHSDLIEGAQEPQVGAPQHLFGASENHYGTPVYRCTGAPGAHFGAPGHHIGAPVHQCTTPPQTPTLRSEENNEMVFQHPFTMMISGPTGKYILTFFL